MSFQSKTVNSRLDPHSPIFGPPRVGIKRRNLPPLQLLAIIHILHLRVIYHQYLTSMITHSRSAIQEGFLLFLCCFLHFNIITYPTKLSANIMLNALAIDRCTLLNLN